MNIKSIFTTQYGEWCVFYKIKESNWRNLKTKRGYWYADPILFEYKDGIYLFTEAFQKNRQVGSLAVSKLVDGEFTEPKEIIRKSYHLSYPCVFQYDNVVYMIPESSQNRTLELYRALDDSLEKWEIVKVLLYDIECVDTTVFEYKSRLYLLTYFQKLGEYITKVYILDIDELKISDVYSISKNDNIYRPAGKIFEKDGTYFRPVQYNLNSYGEKMRLLKIDLDKNDWIGTVVDEYTVDSFGLDNMSKTHTYSQIQDVCTIDALHEYRTFLAPYYIYRRKFHNFYFRVKNFRRKIIDN